MKRCIAVFGATASGKTALALALAGELDGIIISADSMQIYKGMDIGTAKPTKAEQSRIPHRLIDVLSPKEKFSVYDYKRLAEQEIYRAIDLGKIPIITGGTGLYFDALFHNTDFGEMEISEETRETLRQRAESEGWEALLQELASVDPQSAAPLHVRDGKRIIRALEVYYSTGRTLTSFKDESRKHPSGIEYLKLFLNFSDRQKLYDRINLRVDQMISDGLVDETERLLQAGALAGETAKQAIGYKELLPYFQEKKELSLCVETLKQKTRNYAKRQITWFRRYTDAKVIWMDLDPDPVQTAIREAKQFLRR